MQLENVLDISNGIVPFKPMVQGSLPSMQGKGSSNLITFQGDLNYDGRVSMKDLAYLNAGAARQQLNSRHARSVVASESSYCRDVDADFSGKIDMGDFSSRSDWGRTLHTGDETFTGSNATLNWDQILMIKATATLG